MQTDTIGDAIEADAARICAQASSAPLNTGFPHAGDVHPGDSLDGHLRYCLTVVYNVE
jgi:hypothetical protein